MGRLAQHEYMPHAPDTCGTERVNHEDCPAGVDTKRRLYVTRKEKGNVVAYCHNCGNSGVCGGASRFRLASIPRTSTTSEEKLVMPSGMLSQPYSWPKEMLTWLNDNGIDLTDAQKYDIVYDASDRRIVIPKLNKSGDLVMYQSRRLYDDGTPKYLTYKEKDAYYHDPLRGAKHKRRRGTCIIVEDMISAIRCASVGYDTVPLFTSTMDDQAMLTTTKMYDTIVVWLDNDNTTVDRHAAAIRRKAGALKGNAGNARVVSEYIDPKHYDDETITRIIREVLE